MTGAVACDLDVDTTYADGDGLLLTGTTFSVDFGGDGIATTVARSDHAHADLALAADVSALSTELAALRQEVQDADYCPRLTTLEGGFRLHRPAPRRASAFARARNGRRPRRARWIPDLRVASMAIV